MANREDVAVLRQLRTLFSIGAIRELTDGQLLERFATGRGDSAEPAFAALVERHGPMVLRVCRAVLRDTHDAQDAFQATFLVLVKKARSLRVRDSLGPWLHQVAFRTASCARADAVRRRRRDRRAAESAPSLQGGGITIDSELNQALHEEIGRLPERYRVPIVLCDLEGQTCEQAARQMGRPAGTIKSWRARGRQRLRDRLIRRGFAPAAGVAGLVSCADAARAIVPPALRDSTTRAATHCAAGKLASEVVSASAAALTRGALMAMTRHKLRMLSMGILAAGIVVSGLGKLAVRGSGDQAPASPAVERPPRDASSSSNAIRLEREELDRLRGTWLLVATETEGEKVPVPPDRPIKLSIEGRHYRYEAQGGRNQGEAIPGRGGFPITDPGSGVIYIEPTRVPREIDFPVDSMWRGSHLLPHGIYRVVGDTLTLCLSLSSPRRPNEFATRPGDGFWLDTYRRVADETGDSRPSR